MRTVIAITLLKKRSPGHFGRGQLARLFRPYGLGTNGRGVRRVLQVSERERCTTARCPECDGKQEILRSSEPSTGPRSGCG
jgi:hypothetical protein